MKEKREKETFEAKSENKTLQKQRKKKDRERKNISLTFKTMSKYEIYTVCRSIDTSERVKKQKERERKERERERKRITPLIYLPSKSRG